MRRRRKGTELTNKVYVVIAEMGDYSDRDDWVAGVFTDRKVAENLVLEHDGKVKEWDAAYAAWVDRLAYAKQRLIWATKRDQGWSEEVQEREVEKNQILSERPKRPEETFDRLYFVEVPLDTWGEFKF
jgi:hypothetical protein